MATLHTPVPLSSSPRPPSRPRMNSALTLVTPEKAQALLATALGLRAADVQLERGSTSRDKTLSIPATARGPLERLLK